MTKGRSLSDLRRACRAACLLAFVLCFLAPTAGAAAAPAAAPPRRPNIVLLLADDLGPGDLGCYGQKLIRTPNIDQLAAEGMRFTQAYAPCPVCAPTRCSLLTGLHTGHSYIRDNKEIKPEGQLPLPADTVTVAKLLKQGGYATACVGKWGLGFVGTTGDPLNQGFDFFFGHNCQRVAHNHYADHVWRNGQRVMLEGNGLHDVMGKQYIPDLMTDEAVGWLRAHKDAPFFLYFATTLPHVSLQAPEDAVAPYRAKFGPEKPFPAYQDYVACAAPRATYAAMITRLDDHVGRIMRELKSLGLDDNTIVLFASDNGPAFPRVGVDAPFFNSAMGLRGLKEDIYEGGIRAPLIVRWPGHVKPATTSSLVTALYDFMPTALDLANLPSAGRTDGLSIVPTLTGHADQQKPHDYLYWEFGPRGGQRALRKGDWKAVRTGLKKNPDAPVQLYDLATDPTESHDVAKEHPDIVTELKKLMRDARAPSEQKEWNF